MNPELRQTINTISRNLESANEAAQVNIYDFTSHYIDPCLAGIKSYIGDCVSFCFPPRDEHLRRRRGHSQGRAEYGFDFYDDWDEEEENAATGIGWRNDELDSLLAGRGQPRAQRSMSYGARGRRNDSDSDPNLIPKSSYLGFLDRLPFKIGPRGLRYKPSSAGLQENPGGLRIRDVEAEPLINEDEEAVLSEDGARRKGHARTRSHTQASQQSTTTSRSARSDLIMSDEEEDAVPLDDEFAAVMLSRRTTNSGNSDDRLSSKSGSGKRPILSRVSTRTTSNKSLHSNKTRRSSSKKSQRPLSPELNFNANSEAEPPTVLDLKREEAQLEEQEELEIVMKREAATKLAHATGLNDAEAKSIEYTPTTPHNIMMDNPVSPQERPRNPSFSLASPGSPLDANESETEPFPDMSMTPRSRRSSDGNTEPP